MPIIGGSIRAISDNVYDGLDRLISTTRPEGIRVEMEYDDASRPVVYRDALGNETRWVYDDLGRVTSVTFADGTSRSFAYDANGNPTQITDGYADGPNSYQYALNNPVNFSDRMGLMHDTLYPISNAESYRLHQESKEARRQERIAAKAIARRQDEAEAQALFCAVDPMGEEPAHRRLGLHHHFAQMGHPASVVRDKVMAQGGPAGYHVNQTDRLFSELSLPEFKPYADLYVQLVDLQFGVYSLAETGAFRALGQSRRAVGIPNATRLSSAEQATAVRLQKRFALELRESVHEGAEYLDDIGRSYDALGDIRASVHWNEEKFLKSIDQHLLKSNDFTVIDMTGFAPEQMNTVRAHLGALPRQAQSRILRLGF